DNGNPSLRGPTIVASPVGSPPVPRSPAPQGRRAWKPLSRGNAHGPVSEYWRQQRVSRYDRETLLREDRNRGATNLCGEGHHAHGRTQEHRDETMADGSSANLEQRRAGRRRGPGTREARAGDGSSA